MAERRGFVTIDGVQDPDGLRGATTEAFLSRSLYGHFLTHLTDKAYDLAAVRTVLLDPSRIFETKRDAEDPPFGFCYIGSPMPWRTSSGELKRLPKGKALFVYVNSDMEVYDWRFETPPPPGSLPSGKEGLRFAKELLT